MWLQIVGSTARKRNKQYGSGGRQKAHRVYAWTDEEMATFLELENKTNINAILDREQQWNTTMCQELPSCAFIFCCGRKIFHSKSCTTHCLSQ